MNHSFDYLISMFDQNNNFSPNFIKNIFKLRFITYIESIGLLKQKYSNFLLSILLNIWSKQILFFYYYYSKNYILLYFNYIFDNKNVSQIMCKVILILNEIIFKAVWFEKYILYAIGPPNYVLILIDIKFKNWQMSGIKRIRLNL